jgi:Fe-S-cluster containining protein
MSSPALSVARKPRREDLPPDANLCEHCTAKCCRYFALPIETPETRKDFEYIRWYLLHESATVFVEEEDWYLLVHSVCKHLQDDQRCGIYETRPPICREYSTKDCEYEDSWTYDRYFERAEQIAEYIEAMFPPKRGKSRRSPKPSLLPVIG